MLMKQITGKDFIKDTFNDVIDGVIEGGLELSANFNPTAKRTFMSGSIVGLCLPFKYRNRNLILTHNITPLVNKIQQRAEYVQHLISETVAKAGAIDTVATKNRK